MKLQPMGERLLIKRAEAIEKTAGGIYLPDDAKEKPNEGVVLEVGSVETIFKKGDKVLFASYAGISIEGGLIINYDDVLGICK